MAGWRDSMSAFGTIVVPLAGGDSIEGAAPAVTLTLSSTIDRTVIVTGPSAGTAVTRKGFMYRPPGRTISTSNGATGSGSHWNRPSVSVRCAPVRPSTETSAPAMGAPVASITTRPCRPRAEPVARKRATAAIAAGATRGRTAPVVTEVFMGTPVYSGAAELRDPTGVERECAFAIGHGSLSRDRQLPQLAVKKRQSNRTVYVLRGFARLHRARHQRRFRGTRSPVRPYHPGPFPRRKENHS